jgi:hypothetical protein
MLNFNFAFSLTTLTEETLRHEYKISYEVTLYIFLQITYEISIKSEQLQTCQRLWAFRLYPMNMADN